jgi:cell division septal protein FtsQ
MRVKRATRAKARRRKKSPVARVRPFWVPLVLVAAVVVAALGVAATWPGFDPKRIVVIGNHRVTRAEILSRAAIPRRLNIWLQNTGAMRKRIEAIPYVETAAVHRIPPSEIRIVVRERVPFAVLQSGGNAALVDRSLRVLEPATGDEPYPVLAIAAGLVFVPGEFVHQPEAAELREAFETVSARQIVPVGMEFDRFGGLVVTLRSGLRLLLGSQNDLGQKITLADAIIDQIVTGQRRVAAIDLRAPGAPVLVYR